MGMADYFEEAMSSIDLVQDLWKDQQVKLNPLQCEYLCEELTETGSILRGKSSSLTSIRDSDDVRRKALLQFFFAVKRAEKLVRGCCCETEPFLETAVTLAQIKEDIIDILLDLRWWASMIDIAVASVTWMSSGQEIELELLSCAEEHFQSLWDNLHSSDSSLETRASKDKNLLSRKLQELETSYAGIDRTPEQNHQYLLAVHVRSRLENIELESMVELNAYDSCGVIGFGSFGAVSEVKWLGRKCALKQLQTKCKREATNLSLFQHPHIVQFYRYWESSNTPTPYGTPLGTPHGTLSGTHRSDTSMEAPQRLQSHILMELMPVDLAQHLANNGSKVSAGSKRKPEDTSRSSVPMDVAIDVMHQVAKAMWHLNSKEVAHRDLKPNNVLVRPVEEVSELRSLGYVRAKLADFGLAKTRALSSALSSQPAGGTKVYGAPEIWNKDIISDRRFPRRADVWSFGVMFCEILSGIPPFPLENGHVLLGALQAKIKDGLRPDIPEHWPDYLKLILRSCWQLRPEDRPNFSDILRMVRLAQVRSLGLVQKDHGRFTYKKRDSVALLKKTPAPVPIFPGQSKDAALKTSWPWLLIRWITYSFGRRRDLSFQPRSILKRSSLRREGSGSSSSRSKSESKPLGYIVNQVWPRDSTCNTDLDVIFFEGNVGRRKDMSCKDTWVQRGKPNVWWPRDWLPKDLGGDIRVLLLEYSISEEGVEGVLDQLLRVLVFSNRWNRGHTWERPVILVGHSLGCVVIEHLVVALDRRVKSIKILDDEIEIERAKISEAFLSSLAGCFFYAPPWRGLVPSEDLLKHVFGGLSYSRELFLDLCLDSPKLKSLSEDFMRARHERVKLTALIEGFHTLGRTVVPPASVQDLANAGTVVNLDDSNHGDVCKPTNKEHRAYGEFLEFVRGISNNLEGFQHRSNNKQAVGMLNH